EVIQATLAVDFGVDAHFLQTTTLCVEQPKATGPTRWQTPANTSGPRHCDVCGTVSPSSGPFLYL
ncbi:hypothetical protein, partial [Polymorphospora rubra]|uniref:hypothetical protein n=1 Tax=Polymorphospora rubra TaxID=338584 RepID=UPI0033EA6388